MEGQRTPSRADHCSRDVLLQRIVQNLQRTGIRSHRGEAETLGPLIASLLIRPAILPRKPQPQQPVHTQSTIAHGYQRASMHATVVARPVVRSVAVVAKPVAIIAKKKPMRPLPKPTAVYAQPVQRIMDERTQTMAAAESMARLSCRGVSESTHVAETSVCRALVPVSLQRPLPQAALCSVLQHDTSTRPPSRNVVLAVVVSRKAASPQFR